MAPIHTLIAAAVVLIVTLVAASPLDLSKRNLLEPRTSLLDGKVRWSEIANGDGEKTGKDPNGIYYFKSALEHFVNGRNDDERIGVFRTGGPNNEQVEDEMNEFVGTVLEGAGAMWDDVFDVAWIEEQPHVTDSVSAECVDEDEIMDDVDEEDPLEWRMIYRASKALAAGSNGGKAYIHMERTNGRTIFSPASKDPQDHDPDHDGAATVGETWRYGELPMLMRNENVNQIISFWKNAATGEFDQHVEWDAEQDKDSKPRNYLQDVGIDAVPIHLPRVADRPPMKR